METEIDACIEEIFSNKNINAIKRTMKELILEYETQITKYKTKIIELENYNHIPRID